MEGIKVNLKKELLARMAEHACACESSEFFVVDTEFVPQEFHELGGEIHASTYACKKCGKTFQDDR